MKKSEIKKLIDESSEEDLIKLVKKALKKKVVKKVAKKAVKKTVKKVIKVKVEKVKIEEIKKKVYSKETGEEITYDMINVAISLFQPFLPQDFVSKGGPYAKKIVREAVSTLLERMSLEKLNTMIQTYFVIRKDEQYRPSVGTIHEFATYKFQKIVDFLNRKDGHRYGLNNIPGEIPGQFNEKHKGTLEKLATEKERINREFQEKQK